MKASLLPKLPGRRIVLALGLLWAPLALAGWKNNPEAVTILGRAKLPSATTLFAPSGIAVNPASGKVFVVDGGNHRVLRFSSAAALGNGQAAEAVLGQVHFKSTAFGLSDSLLRDPGKAVVDAAGNLWLSDTGNYRILRWANGDTIPSGSPAVLVLGNSNFTTRDVALGASSFYRPGGLAFDDSGSLWVADAWNNRVLRCDNPAAKGNGGAADHVVGQPDFVTTTAGLSAMQFDEPCDLAIDAQGRLWVSDFDNVRILRFDTPSAQILPAANGVLGQPDFVSEASGSGPAQSIWWFRRGAAFLPAIPKTPASCVGMRRRSKPMVPPPMACSAAVPCYRMPITPALAGRSVNPAIWPWILMDACGWCSAAQNAFCIGMPS